MFWRRLDILTVFFLSTGKGPYLHLKKTLQVKGVDRCHHISCVSSEKIWVSDNYNKLVLTDTSTGDTMHQVKDSLHNFDSSVGLHAVNRDSELIYCDQFNNVKKFSKKLNREVLLDYAAENEWKLRCVFCCPSTGDLLLGMWKIKSNQGKVKRYNNAGELTQIISHDGKQRFFYRKPIYITENNNGDVVVSDVMLGVVVADCEGRHRFTYSGPKKGSTLLPQGICTDALSHILVCDAETKTVQMIDKNGSFLSYLLTELSPGMVRPYAISYDPNTHLLFVSTQYNKISVYKFIDRRHFLTF